jgi:hypothetical protein
MICRRVAIIALASAAAWLLLPIAVAPPDQSVPDEPSGALQVEQPRKPATVLPATRRSCRDAPEQCRRRVEQNDR